MYGLQIIEGDEYGRHNSKWTEFEEFETREEAMERIAEIEHVDRCYKVDGIIEFEEVSRDDDMIAHYRGIIEKKKRDWEAQEKAKVKAQAETRARQKEAAERRRYEKLKAKYEGGKK